MRRKSLWAIVSLPLALGAAVTLLTAATATGLTVRSSVYHLGVSVKPGTGLSNGQYVRVTWHGLGPNHPVFFRQCTAHPTKVGRDCSALYTDTGFTGSDGTGVQYEPVTEGDVRSQSGGKFACTNTVSCTLGVFTGAALKTGRLSKISFEPTPSGCPTPIGTPISGGGADQANHALYNWDLTLCEPPYRNSVNYIPANSQDGRDNYIAGLSDFAVSAVPFTPSEQHKLAAKGKKVAYAPLTDSGLVLAYKIYSQGNGSPGAQVTDLRLTPALVAQIFTGQLSNWQTSPDVTSLNPNDRFPPSILPLVRGDHSFANVEFTTWLTDSAKSSLPTDWPGPSDTYPISYITQNAAIVGGDALANAIADPFTVGDSNDFYQVGYIGFIDSSEAAYYGLPTARIKNAAGKYVSATPKSIHAALAHATKNSDGVTVTPNYTTTDPAAYPMPVVTYAGAPTKGIDPSSGWTLQQLLKYAATTGQSHLPQGYTALTAAQAQQTKDAAAKVPATAPASAGSGAGGGSGTLPPTGGSDGAAGGGQGSAPPSGGGSAPPAPSGGSSHSIPHLLSEVLTAGTGRMVLPALAGLSLLGLLGGFMLLHFGEGTPYLGGAATTLRGWLRL